MAYFVQSLMAQAGLQEGPAAIAVRQRPDFLPPRPKPPSFGTCYLAERVRSSGGHLAHVKKDSELESHHSNDIQAGLGQFFRAKRKPSEGWEVTEAQAKRSRLTLCEAARHPNSWRRLLCSSRRDTILQLNRAGKDCQSS